MGDSKEDIIRKGYGAFSAGDMETLGGLYTDDVVQSMGGNNQFSGEHKGRDGVLALYGRLFEASGGTFSVALESLETKGDKVVSVHRSTGQRDGKTLDVEESITFSFAGDKVSRLDVTSADDAAEDAFWD